MNRIHLSKHSIQLSASLLMAINLLLFHSCGSDDCEGNHSALPLAGFYSSDTSSTPISIIGLSVEGENAPNDSILLNNAVGVSQCYLPLRIDEDNTTYSFSIAADSVTTYRSNVTFYYDVEPYFVSAACGAVYNYRIKKISCEGNLIDSVVCPGNLITNANIENLRIYVATSN